VLDVLYTPAFMVASPSPYEAFTICIGEISDWETPAKAVRRVIVLGSVRIVSSHATSSFISEDN
jgi:hypothetical protein